MDFSGQNKYFQAYPCVKKSEYLKITKPYTFVAFYNIQNTLLIQFSQ